MAATLAVLVGLVVVYFIYFLESGPAPVAAASAADGTASLTLQTVPTYGHHPFPDWVSYMAKDPAGKWEHTTIFKIPAHTLVHVTIYQYDGASGLRNNFLSGVSGTIGGTETIDGTPMGSINPDNAAHTFTVPDLGINAPLPGVNPNAKNQCSVAPCTMSEAHVTITFSFRTPGKGTYRWQCFVPCGAGTLFGNGGPMQTIGYMSGLIEVA